MCIIIVNFYNNILRVDFMEDEISLEFVLSV